MKLNGSIPNINLGLSASVIGLLIFTIVVGGYYVAETKTVSEKNNRDIDILGKNQDVFVKSWIDAQKSQNKVSNESENQLLNLSRTNDKIIKQQLENERVILNNTNNTLTSIKLQEQAGQQRNILQKSILNATNQTNTLVKFLADNFGENSDYLEKENYQYNQANETFKILQDNNKLLQQLNQQQPQSQLEPDVPITNNSISGPPNPPTNFEK